MAFFFLDDSDKDEDIDESEIAVVVVVVVANEAFSATVVSGDESFNSAPPFDIIFAVVVVVVAAEAD